MKVEKLTSGDLLYPTALFIKSEQPILSYIGNLEILRQPLLGVFCSVKCPASLILKAHDLAKELADDKQGVVSGFQAPVEKEMLTMLLRGNGNLVICPARGLDGMRVPVAWQAGIESGRLLVISAFAANIKRPNAAMASQRNLFACALASEVLIIHAEDGSKIKALYGIMQSNGKVVRILANP